ncbi:hypothetical protein niasHS_011847 [Heterodera schachtii]|uniref:Annexin n=1 Tax=Heterodera schachtii TaxID=97005 RepID=A0ABD2IRI2_HETSC
MHDPVPEIEETRGFLNARHAPLILPIFYSMGGSGSPAHYSPWTALLFFETKCPNSEQIVDRCTGFVVSSTLLLTAAHCAFLNYTDMLVRCNFAEEMHENFHSQWMRFSTKQLSIFIGFDDLENNTNENAVMLRGEKDIKNIILPSEFTSSQLNSGKALKYDYAIIQLVNPLSLGAYIRPICLSSRALDLSHRLGQMAGWGQILNEKNEASVPNKLQLLTVPIQETEECASREGLKKISFDQKFHMCAGGRSQGGLAGDSGSALVIEVSGRAYAVGLFSMLTTNSPFRNIMPDIFMKTTEMCGTLETVNGGTPICKNYFKEIDIECYSILREHRINLANKACGEIQCKNKFSAVESSNGYSANQTENPAEKYAERIFKLLEREDSEDNVYPAYQILDILISLNFSTCHLIGQVQHHNESLIESIQKKLPNGGQKELILSLLYESAIYDAKSLYNAMMGIGTDEEILTEILISRTNAQIRAIRKAYVELYHEELKKHIDGDTSGAYNVLLTKLIAANRKESATVNIDKALQDAPILFAVHKLGVDEETFFTKMTIESQKQLNETFRSYVRFYDDIIEQKFAAEFGGDVLQALNAISQNERDLIRLVVTRAESGDMPTVGAEFEKVNGVPLTVQIVSETELATKLMLANLASAYGGDGDWE